MISEAELENWFQYHAPMPGQNELYTQIRSAGFELARVIIRCTPPSADQTAAVRKVREAVMVANQSIACGGR